MEQSWLSENWFEVIQTAGVVGGLLFTAYTVRKDERARRITNLIALGDQYGRIWQEFYARPMLSRVLRGDVDLTKETISDDEHLFVKMLILHLDAVRQTTKAGVFVKMHGVRKDVQEFFSYPIPKAIWEKIKPFQDEDFVLFVDDCLRP